MPWRREMLLFAVLAGLGLLLFPALVYGVGVLLLGEYRAGASAGAFYADLYAELAAPSPWAWLLVLGPWLGVQWLRLLWLPFRAVLRRRGPAARAEGAPEPGEI